MRGKYIEDGRVERSRIALDIKYRKLRRQEIEVLINDPLITKAFFGETYNEKVSSQKWTEDYLETLALAVVGESFNPDYLLYLNDVAEHVAQIKRKKEAIRIGLALAAGAIFIAWLVSKMVNS